MYNSNIPYTPDNGKRNLGSNLHCTGCIGEPSKSSPVFGSYAVSEGHEWTSGTRPIFFGASIDSNPLEIYIVLL